MKRGFAYGWWSLNEAWICVWLVEFEWSVRIAYGWWCVNRMRHSRAVIEEGVLNG
jgi:hypothetical protein